MSTSRARPSQPVNTGTDRRESALESALVTFARYGYRKTSMEQIAQAARISRPGLYFLFSSKEALFRAAVTGSLERDLAAVEHALANTSEPLADRLLESFGHWTGRYLGPLTLDVAALTQDNSDLLGTISQTAPRRFEAMITAAIAIERGRESAIRVAQTMISTSIGIKHQVDTTDAYLERLRVAIGLFCLEDGPRNGQRPSR